MPPEQRSRIVSQACGSPVSAPASGTSPDAKIPSDLRLAAGLLSIVGFPAFLMKLLATLGLVVALTGPAAADPAFRGSVSSLPDEVTALVRRYTWHEGCPVPLNRLAYLSMTYWGFDGAVHDGEMIVYASLADEVLAIFKELFVRRFPIDKMRIAARYGDKNVTHDDDDTEAFACRADYESPGKFSKHAYGIAIDINPVVNPLIEKGAVSPADGASNADRAQRRPGGIYPGDAIIDIFAEHGWTWGGFWQPPDLMHFQKLMNGDYVAEKLRLVPPGERLEGLGN
jgi:hypothetical protein